jgi:hypothetical protein
MLTPLNGVCDRSPSRTSPESRVNVRGAVAHLSISSLISSHNSAESSSIARLQFSHLSLRNYSYMFPGSSNNASTSSPEQLSHALQDTLLQLLFGVFRRYPHCPGVNEDRDHEVVVPAFAKLTIDRAWENTWRPALLRKAKQRQEHSVLLREQAHLARKTGATRTEASI